MGITRFRFALRAFSWHLAGSVLFALLASLVVFLLWYPRPYASLLGGLHLFLLVVTVDVVCGPLLTFVLSDFRKSARELTIDLGLVALVQVVALVFGLHTMWLARPVYLAYEVDRFRVVTYADIEPASWPARSANVVAPSWSGPQTIAVRVAHSDDADYLEQVNLSIRGVDAAFRPDRWIPYEGAKKAIGERAQPIAVLQAKYPDARPDIERAIQASGKSGDGIRWLPVQSRRNSDWVVLIDSESLKPIDFLHLNGF